MEHYILDQDLKKNIIRTKKKKEWLFYCREENKGNKKEEFPYRGRYVNEIHDFVLEQMEKADKVAAGNKEKV